MPKYQCHNQARKKFLTYLMMIQQVWIYALSLIKILLVNRHTMTSATLYKSIVYQFCSSHNVGCKGRISAYDIIFDWERHVYIFNYDDVYDLFHHNI